MAEMHRPTPMHTFVVRFRCEWSGGEPQWRGHIEHVQSGEGAYFLDWEKMLAFIRRYDAVMGDVHQLSNAHGRSPNNEE